MSAQVHDHSMHETRGDAVGRARRPRWLWPALAVAIVVAGLVITDVLSLSSVLYFGLFGGMLLMHGGGHGGHGGHGGSGGDSGGGTRSDAERLSHLSPGSQARSSGSATGLDDRATNDSKASETDNHGQHSSHGCH